MITVTSKKRIAGKFVNTAHTNTIIRFSEAKMRPSPSLKFHNCRSSKTDVRST